MHVQDMKILGRDEWRVLFLGRLTFWKRSSWFILKRRLVGSQSWFGNLREDIYLVPFSKSNDDPLNHPSLALPGVFTDVRIMVFILTFWRWIFFFQILAHPVFKLWVIHKPNKVALWNKRHFEERKMEIIQHV